MRDKVETVWWSLRIGLGLGAFLAGADKFFGLLADWSMYLSPVVERVLPFGASTFMSVVGVVEMAVGAAILAGFTRVGGYVMMAWLAGIAANLSTTGMFYDLAVRDLEIALGAFALARLTEARQEAGASVPGAVRARAAIV